MTESLDITSVTELKLLIYMTQLSLAWYMCEAANSVLIKIRFNMVSEFYGSFLVAFLKKNCKQKQ
jgi:hypothetical protein